MMENKCRHCLEYNKIGIWKNATAFVKRLNEGMDTLTQEDLNEDEHLNDSDEVEDEAFETSGSLKMDRRDNLASALEQKLSEVETW